MLASLLEIITELHLQVSPKLKTNRLGYDLVQPTLT